MKAVIAIDSFKGSISSVSAGNAAARGVLRACPDAEVIVRPIADGGEGTVDTLVRGLNGHFRTVTVTGPLSDPVECTYGILENGLEAVIEMSAAAGLPLVPQKRRDPMYTTTYGVGEVIADAVNMGCRKFIVGIGGSATNDGGVGMLQALGFGFLDEEGRQIPYGARGLKDLKSITTDNVMPGLSECEFRIACDVDNALCGERGATAVFGPQKGATQEMVIQIDKWMADYADLAAGIFPDADANYPGAGAAGGLGFAFRTFLGGILEPGIEVVLHSTGLEEYIRDADLVITGEGRMDGQTLMGKAPIGVARLAKKYGKPVIALAGSVTDDAYTCNEAGIDAIFPVIRELTTLGEAMSPKTAAHNMEQTAAQVMRVFVCRETKL